MEVDKFVRESSGLTYLVVRKELVQDLIIDHKLDCELDEIEIRMLKNELEFIDLELKLISLELKRDSIMATMKHSDHHFKKMSEYKYNLIEAEKINETDQRLIINTLRRENESLKNERKKFKIAIETIKGSIEALESFVNNNSEGPEMVVNKIDPDKKIKRPACNVVEIRATLEKELFSYSDIEHMQWHLDKIKKEF